MGGFFAARWLADNERGQARLSAITVASLVPCLVGFVMFRSNYCCLASLMPLVVLFSAFLGPTYAMLQRLVPDELRATSMAIVMLLANLIGFGIGPLIVGALSDAFTPYFGVDALRYAMLAMALVAFWAAYHFWQAGETVREDLENISATAALGQPVIGLRENKAY